MRIVHLYHAFHPQRDGIEDYLAELVRFQAKQPKLEVVVLTANSHPLSPVGSHTVNLGSAVARF